MLKKGDASIRASPFTLLKESNLFSALLYLFRNLLYILNLTFSGNKEAVVAVDNYDIVQTYGCNSAFTARI